MTVILGLPHAGGVDPEWLASYDALEKPPGWRSLHTARGVIATSRNLIVEEALHWWRQRDQEEPSHGPHDPQDPHDDNLFFWDDDLLLAPDALLRLLRHHLPVVGGLYVFRGEPYKPIAGRQLTPPGAPGPRRCINLRAFKQGLQAVDFLGAGILLIRRDVLERLSPPWFQYVCGTTQAEDWPEDAFFCERVRAAGFPVVLDFDVQGMHLMSRGVTYADAVEYASTAGLSEPATAELAAAAYTVRPWPPDPAHPEGIDARQQHQQQQQTARPSQRPQQTRSAPTPTHRQRKGRR